MEKKVEYTKDSLKNTWGIVESKEHAEYIIELAKGAGFEFTGGDKKEGMFFNFYQGELLAFWSDKHAANDNNEKQITIPLPPKDKAEKPDLSKPPKHFDCVCNKCGGKCCIGNCDKWPKVGDRVRWDKNDYSGTVKAVSEGKAWCKLDSGLYHTINFDRLKKPKTEQELKIEELQTKLCNNNAVDNYILACDIINGEIKGLSYNP